MARRILTSILVASLMFGQMTLPAYAVSSWNPTLIVNTESFSQIDSGDGTTAVDLRFGSSTSTLQLLTNGTFQFNKSLSVVGGISGSYLTIDHQANISGSLLVKNTITSKSTVSGANLTFMGVTSSYILGSVGIGKSGTPNTKLEVVGTISGSVIRAQESLASSGTLVVKKRAGTGTGNILTVDTIGLVYNATNKRVGIGTAAPAYGILDIFGRVMTIGDTEVTSGSRTDATTKWGQMVSPHYTNAEEPVHVVASYNSNGFNRIFIGGGLTSAYNAATTIQFATAETSTTTTGSERMRIDSTGNVGIGTTAPKAKLDVVGTISGSRLSISNNANISGSLLTVGGITSRSTISGANLTFMGATASYILGSLGIGKTSPATKLEVAGTISGRLVTQNGAGDNYFMGNVGIGIRDPDSNLQIGDTNTAGAVAATLMTDTDLSSSLNLFENSADIGAKLTYNGASDYFTISTGNSASAQADRLTILRDSGNVGIDTTSPAAKLSVSGSMIVNDAGYDNDVRMEGDTDANLFFMDASTDRVGIGTATPQAKLNVVQTTDDAKGVLVTGPGTDQIDGLSLSKSGNVGRNWIHWSQGSGTADWRVGMESYDLTIYNAAGAAVTPSSPGEAYFTIAQANGNVGIDATSPGSRLSVSGSAVIGNNIGSNAAKAQLDVKGTISGARLSVSGNANITGSLLTVGGITSRSTISGASLYGYNLLNSQSATTGSVLVSRTTGQSEWKSPTGSLVWFLDGNAVVAVSQGATVTMPFGMNLTSVNLKAKGAPTGAALIVDINEGGTTVFSTRPQIYMGYTTGGTGAVLSDTILANGSEITVDIDQIGSTFAGSGITIQLNGVRRY